MVHHGQRSLKKHQLHSAMKKRGFAFLREGNGGHSLWRHAETGKVMTIGTRINDPSALDAYVRKLMRGTY